MPTLLLCNLSIQRMDAIGCIKGYLHHHQRQKQQHYCYHGDIRRTVVIVIIIINIAIILGLLVMADYALWMALLMC